MLDLQSWMFPQQTVYNNLYSFNTNIINSISSTISETTDKVKLIHRHKLLKIINNIY